MKNSCILSLRDIFGNIMSGIDGDKELIKAPTFQPWNPLTVVELMAN